ncbi:MAG: galactokinase, partial [Verrucomicrobiae bacterium]|nr:galactokinase [Verrucomicrobiae bacterium]
MRLREVVPDRQKVVAEVGGRPFLFYVLDQVAGAGLRDVVLCTGYKSQQVMDVVGLSYKELRIRYSV